MIANRNAAEPDIVLVGGGIMSATLGTVLKELEPTLNIVLFETLHDSLRRVVQLAVGGVAGPGVIPALGTLQRTPAQRSLMH